MMEIILTICVFLVVSFSTGQQPIELDSLRTTCAIAIAKGYPCEVHQVTTSDGYILEIHRISRGRNEVAFPKNNVPKKVIFLQHGLEDSSSTWVINMETQSLGFIAADSNLDVWMGNVRGNIYSRNHILMTSLDPRFWGFTFNEIAKKDLPAMINYVLTVTQQPSLYYVGHSQGTLTAFIQFSQDPNWSKDRIQQFHALSPCAYLGHSTTPIRSVAPLLSSNSKLFPLTGLTQFNPDNVFAALQGALNCNWISCTNYAVYMTNSDMSTYNKNLLSGKLETYGDNPVPYPLDQSTVPTYLYWSAKDVFTQRPDFEQLKNELRSVVHEYQNNNYDHMGFVWSLNAANDIYSQIIRAIKAS